MAIDGLKHREIELLAKAQSGDREAFAQLVEPYQGRVYSSVIRLLGNTEDASEITQEALLRTFWKVTGFHGKAHFYTWFYRIAMNLSYRRVVERRREPIASPPAASSDENGDSSISPEVVSTALSPREEAASQETRLLVRKALALLKPSDFEILVLREFEELSYGQLAHQLEVPEGTVMSRLHRARLALAEQLGKLGVGQ